MFERYKERARRAIFFAREETVRRGSPEIATSDLVLGLTRDERQPGDPFFFLHEKAADLRSLLGMEAVSDPSLSRIDVPLAITSKKALAYAAEEADRDGSHEIDAHHLLRGVLRTDDATSKKLSDAGWTLKKMRQLSGDVPRPPGPERRPVPWIIKASSRLILIGIALLFVVVVILYMRSQR